MTKPIDDAAVGCDEATDGSQALRECAHDEVNVLSQAEMVADASALLAEDTDAVGLVHHNGDVFVLLLQLNDFRQLAEVTLHAEDAVNYYKLHAVGLALLNHLLEILHVVVLVLELRGKAETTAIDDACVVAVVADDVVVAVNKLTYNAAVNGEACCEAECLVLANKLSKFFLKLNMNVERTIEETAAGATTAIFLHSSATSIDDALVASQACICIRAKHQHSFAFHDDLCALLAFYLAEVRVYALRHKLLWECVFSASVL